LQPAAVFSLRSDPGSGLVQRNCLATAPASKSHGDCDDQTAMDFLIVKASWSRRRALSVRPGDRSRIHCRARHYWVLTLQQGNPTEARAALQGGEGRPHATGCRANLSVALLALTITGGARDLRSDPGGHPADDETLTIAAVGADRAPELSGGACQATTKSDEQASHVNGPSQRGQTFCGLKRHQEALRDTIGCLADARTNVDGPNQPRQMCWRRLGRAEEEARQSRPPQSGRSR